MNEAVRQLEHLINLVANYELDELSVSNLSQDMRLSRWQLQRMFLALTTTTLNDYLRGFKLSRSAEMLVQTDMRILEIAIITGFGSQEAFTRSFKERFNRTPRQYRMAGVLDDITFELFIPKERQWSKAMNIEIKTKRALILSGKLAYFNGHGTENANNFEVIPKLWSGLNSEVHRQCHNIEVWYGYIYESDQREKGQLRYLAGYDENDGTVTISNEVKENIAEQQYAILPHHGLLARLGETLDAFYGEWLPNSDYRMTGNFNIEVYDSRFNPEADDSYFETWVPVELVGLK